MKERFFNKNVLSKTALVIYLLLSGGYIIYSIFISYRNQLINNVAIQARTATIEELINQANSCQPFTVFSEEEEIQLVKMNCEEGQNNNEEQPENTEE